MSLRLLIDAPEFMEAVACDLATAKRTAFVQAMTFEGDAACWWTPSLSTC